MPISAKGQKVMADFKERYGKRGKSAFFATANKKGKGSSFYKLAHGK